MVKIGVIDIKEDISESDWIILREIITPEKQIVVNKMRFERDKKRTVYGEILARYLVGQYSGLKIKDMKIANHRYGKPYVKNISNIYFNISHAGRYIVCGVSESEIGIDIEEIREIDMNIAKSWFHIKEYEYIVNQRVSDRISLFYDFWTLKESYIKYLGIGMNMQLNSFWFKIHGQGVELMIDDVLRPHFSRYRLDDKHKLAVCTHQPYEVNLDFIKLEDIIFTMSRE